MHNATIVCSLAILSFFSIWINSFCIYIINVLKFYRSKPASIYVLNLFATHLFQAFVVLPTYTGKKIDASNETWSYLFADGFLFTYLLSFYSVSLTTLCISVDRFLAAFLMTKYSKYVTPKNVLRTVISMWVYVVLLCLVPFIPSSKNQSDEQIPLGRILQQETIAVLNTSASNVSTQIAKSPNSQLPTPSQLEDNNGVHLFGHFLANSTHFGEIPGPGGSLSADRRYYNPQKEWTVFMLFFNAFLPLVFTALCYVYVIVRLRTAIDVVPMITERTDDTSDEKSDTTLVTQIKESKQYKHVTCVALALSSMYFILWGPSIFYYTIHSVAGHFFICNWENSSSEKFLVYFIKYASFMCCLVSPIIYCYRHPKVKKILRRATRLSTLRSNKTTESKL